MISICILVFINRCHHLLNYFVCLLKFIFCYRRCRRYYNYSFSFRHKLNSSDMIRMMHRVHHIQRTPIYVHIVLYSQKIQCYTNYWKVFLRLSRQGSFTFTFETIFFFHTQNIGLQFVCLFQVITLRTVSSIVFVFIYTTSVYLFFMFCYR